MNKKDYSVIIAVIALVISLISVALLFINSSKIGIVTIDIYLGIVATLIGICATIMVGFQIYNHIDFKDKIKSIEELETRMNKTYGKIMSSELAHKYLSLHVSNVYLYLASIADEWNKSLNFLIISIITQGSDSNSHTIKFSKDNDTTKLLSQYKDIKNIILKNKTLITKKPAFWDVFKSLSYRKDLDNIDEIELLHREIIVLIERAVVDNDKIIKPL